jgi:hypothetical protein
MSHPDSKPRIHCGTFDAETNWRDESLAKLPAIPDAQTRKLVSAMDELLFVFCRDQDVLLTRYAMDEAHLHYLHDIGFQFNCNEADLDIPDCADSAVSTISTHQTNIFERLSAVLPTHPLNRFIPEGAVLEPYAVLDGMDTLAAQQQWICEAPSIDVIRHVNSKLYSTELKDKLGISNVSRIVTGSTELDRVGRELLAAGPLLIKDTFGVSGKGNLLITTESMLERVSAYIAAQERKGKRTLFIIEPLLHKELDFSCQFELKADGAFSFISVQQVINSDFAYQGSVTAAPPLMRQLERDGYFDLMEAAAWDMHEQGYYGHVCVDSMLLQDGTLVPLVEINARKSMSLIKHQLDTYLASYSLTGQLTYVSITCPVPLSFSDVLHAVEREGLLFGHGRESGVIPLSANTFTVNRQASGRSKARLYVSIVANDPAVREKLDVRLRQLLASFTIIMSS